ADTARELGAADGDGGDGVKLEQQADIRIAADDPAGQEDARQRREERAGHVGQHDVAPVGDAEIARRLFGAGGDPAADREEMQAEARAMEQLPGDQDDENRPEDRHRYAEETARDRADDDVGYGASSHRPQDSR